MLPAADKMQQWWTKSDAYDAHLRERFGASVELAQQGGLREWDASPEGTLARILLLDQVSRNIFRGSAQMYAGDELALAATLALLEGDAETLPAIYQYFALMPLMHAEDVALQERSVKEFKALVSRTPSPTKESIANAVEFAEEHRDVVAKWGRFPHRNELLGRESTPAELEFLKDNPGW